MANHRDPVVESARTLFGRPEVPNAAECVQILGPQRGAWQVVEAPIGIDIAIAGRDDNEPDPGIFVSQIHLTVEEGIALAESIIGVMYESYERKAEAPPRELVLAYEGWFTE